MGASTKIICALVILLALPSLVSAQVWVNPYTRRDGTAVQGHYRSVPDGNSYNNWSYPGNSNPYTGRVAPANPNSYLNNYNGGNSYGLGANTQPRRNRGYGW